MDHFALPDDDLYIAWKQGKLHRNFMGYTTTHTSFLLGLGVSSISDTGTAYSQNHKELANYERLINEGKFAANKGCFLSPTDVALKDYILQTACKGKVIFREEDKELIEELALPHLQEVAEDGLISFKENGFTVLESGRQYLRNICQAFDQKWWQSNEKTAAQLFSKSV
jgi:oxygen-independent coproporphyrinogen-3 oxidase